MFFRGFIVALLSSWYSTEGLNLCLDDHGCCKLAVPGKLLSRKVYKRPPKMHIPERSLFVWIYGRLWVDSFLVASGDEQFQAFLLLSVFGFYYFYFILFSFSISSFYRQSARYKCWKDEQRCLSACFNPILSKSHSQPKVLLKIVILAERKFWICLFYLVDVLHCGGGKMVSQLFHFHWCSYFAKNARFWDECGCFE